MLTFNLEFYSYKQPSRVRDDCKKAWISNNLHDCNRAVRNKWPALNTDMAGPWTSQQILAIIR